MWSLFWSHFSTSLRPSSWDLNWTLFQVLFHWKGILLAQGLFTNFLKVYAKYFSKPEIKSIFPNSIHTPDSATYVPSSEKGGAPNNRLVTRRNKSIINQQISIFAHVLNIKVPYNNWKIEKIKFPLESYMVRSIYRILYSMLISLLSRDSQK